MESTIQEVCLKLPRLFTRLYSAEKKRGNFNLKMDSIESFLYCLSSRTRASGPVLNPFLRNSILRNSVLRNPVLRNPDNFPEHLPHMSNEWYGLMGWLSLRTEDKRYLLF